MTSPTRGGRARRPLRAANLDADPHPGAATYRGATILPTGDIVRVRPSGAAEPESTLRATGRTRRALGRRLPVLTGYTGGAIPTHVEGTVRVGGPTAGFWLWLATSVPAFAAVLFAAAANSARGVLAICVVYLVVTVLLGSRVGPR